MKIVNTKTSNYIGQVKEKDEVSMDNHMVSVDKDLQNLRIEVNKIIRYFRGGSYNDINVGSNILGKGASAPGDVTVSSTNIVLPGFDGNATTEQLYGCFELMHGYKEGSVLHPHLHWMPSSANTGNVRWQMEYFITKSFGVAISTSTTLAVSSSATGTAWKEVFTDFPEISGTNLKIGNQFCFRLFRVPTGVDTYADDAVVMTVGIHYEQNSLGSASEFTKT